MAADGRLCAIRLAVKPWFLTFQHYLRGMQWLGSAS
ncbi:hypothetical protein SAMN05216193_10640 [Pseudomonas jinjuensis]|uniref:Uncharacterized protein n=1 Tax=Pseudomonas jinjuensis TaxID=198616 RepID=A0A1H0F3T6_9PSED|nr:hypothetical protein SAMN05216193_10640 [Pseudomonas jinjuensis]